MPKSKSKSKSKTPKSVAKASRKSKKSAKKSARLLRSQASLPSSDEADAVDSVDRAIAFADEAEDVAGSESAVDAADDVVSNAAADSDNADGSAQADSDNADDSAQADSDNADDNAGASDDAVSNDADADEAPNSDFDSDSDDQDLEMQNSTARGGFITPSAVEGEKNEADAGLAHTLSPKERKVPMPASPLNTPKGAQLEKAAAPVKGKSSDLPVRGNADSDDDVIIVSETLGTGEIPPGQVTKASVHGRAPRRPLAPWVAQEDVIHDAFTLQQGNASAAVNTARSRSRSPPPASAGGAACQQPPAALRAKVPTPPPPRAPKSKQDDGSARGGGVRSRSRSPPPASAGGAARQQPPAALPAKAPPMPPPPRAPKPKQGDGSTHDGGARMLPPDDQKSQGEGQEKIKISVAPTAQIGGAAAKPAPASDAANETLVLQCDEQAKELAAASLRDKEQQRLIDHLRGVLEGSANQQQRLYAELREAKLLAKGLVPPPTPEMQRMQNPEYSARFESLLRTGASGEEAHDALEATREDGKYSATRADAYLKSETQKAVQQAVQRLRENAADAEAAAGAIGEDSALGQFIADHPETVEACLRLRELHANTKMRGAHSGLPALVAANIARLPSVANDSSMKRLGVALLCNVAMAVSIDCDECQKIRKTLEEQEMRKAEAQKAKAKAAEANKKKQQEAKDLQERKRLAREHGPITINFNPLDSRLDKSLKPGHCAKATCTKRWSKQDEYLYLCTRCKKGYHLLCTCLTLVEYKGKETFYCSACMDDIDHRTHNGEVGLQPKVLGSDICRGKAPPCLEAAGAEDEPPADRAAAKRGAAAAAASAAAAPPPSTPLGTHTAPRTPSGGEAAEGTTHGGADGVTHTQLNFGSKIGDSNPAGKSNTKPTIQVKDYVQWETVPLGWKPKEGKDEPKEHPEKGYGKLAYQRWRRLNVSNRDVVKAGGSSLGPLTRGLHQDMRIVLGTQLMAEPALKSFWPAEELTDEVIKQWNKKDPAFDWFTHVQDEVLLELLDKRFGVQKPDLFLSKRFPSDLPALSETGELMYHGHEFCRWSTTWQAELAELQRAGCDLDGVDLRQALLNALSTNPTLHNKAIVLPSTSPLVLIAKLRDWVMQEEQAQESRQNEQKALLDQQKRQSGQSSAQTPAPSAGAGGTPSKAHDAMALLTQMHSMMQQQQTPGAPAPFAKTALPVHMKVCGKDGEMAKCNGCGNVWNRARAIPCFHACKFVEHPEFNRELKDKAYPRRESLTWKDFRTRYANTTPPASFLQWEERDKKYHAGKGTGKRPRPEDTQAASNKAPA